MNLIIFLYLIGFIRTMIVFLAIYFIIKLFARYVLPIILENKIRQMQENMNEKNHRHKPTGKHEGEVTIDYGSQKSNNNQKQNEGEYVDFEEVD